MIYVLLMIGVLGSNGFELLGIEIGLKLKKAMTDCEEILEFETVTRVAVISLSAQTNESYEWKR